MNAIAEKLHLLETVAPNDALLSSMLDKVLGAVADQYRQKLDAAPGATLFDFGGLQVELKQLLGVPVDLVTPGDLPIKIRDYVLAEARPV